MEHVRKIQARVARPVERGLGAPIADRLGFPVFENAAKGHVILVVLPDARQMLDRRDAVSPKLGVRSDPGLHEHLRRIDRAQREDNFPLGEVSALLAILG